MADVRIQCCGVCGCPLEHHDGRTHQRKAHTRKEGLVISFGWSRGGWGRREYPIELSEEVCGECFDAAEPVFRAILDYLRDRRGGESDKAPLWAGELASGGRKAALRGVLRALPSGRS